jgi:hypothetical protein
MAFQACMTCKLLKIEQVATDNIEVSVPSCPHHSFTTFSRPDAWGRVAVVEYDPADSHSIDEICHILGIVQIGNAYYRPTDSLEEYTTKETPRSVDRLLDTTGFEKVEVPTLTKEEIDQIRLDASGYKEPEWAMTEDEYEDHLMELADDDLEPEDQPWFEFNPGNRNGVLYNYLGSFWKAVFEPMLWQHSCECGVHKFTGTAFTDDIELNGRHVSPLIVEKLAKVFYGEMLLKDNPKAKKCSICQLPTEEDTCPFCGDNKDMTMYYTKSMGILSSLDFDTIVSMDSSIEELTETVDAVNLNKFIKKNSKRKKA